MQEPCIAVFDIGKTNKKLLLFNEALEVIYQTEQKFPTIEDADGDECDDLAALQQWVKSSIKQLMHENQYDIKALNFSTYGASLVFIDAQGKPLCPLYNYLKEIPGHFAQELFKNHGGETEFCRKTASPSLGKLLNSGIQLRWMKSRFPGVIEKSLGILHFPQYLSYLFTGEMVSEPTSIGCHTFLWDFDNNQYHPWLANEGFHLPQPVKNNHTSVVTLQGKEVLTGTGIHDSSASLVPYLMGSKEPFLLVSTGTWCINMNPFNHAPLTNNQLQNDCLSFLSPEKQPVKASRFFMGHIHDVNVQRLVQHFNEGPGAYKKVEIDEGYIKKCLAGTENNAFFKNGMPDGFVDNEINLNQFKTFEQAYNRLMYDLTLCNKKSINLILNAGENITTIYVSGGFARNGIFVRLLATFFPNKRIFTSEVDNASALGAALTIFPPAFKGQKPVINLGKIVSINDAGR